LPGRITVAASTKDVVVRSERIGGPAFFIGTALHLLGGGGVHRVAAGGRDHRVGDGARSIGCAEPGMRRLRGCEARGPRRENRRTGDG